MSYASCIINAPMGDLRVEVEYATTDDWVITAVSWLDNEAILTVAHDSLPNEVEHHVQQAFTTFFNNGDDDLLLRLPVQLLGTPFQQAVWQACRTIPCGQTSSYQALGDKIGRPKAQQAIGQALKVNPLPVIVPCHRVLPASGKKGGKLGGYMGQLGSPIKQALLNHEQHHALDTL